MEKVGLAGLFILLLRSVFFVDLKHHCRTFTFLLRYIFDIMLYEFPAKLMRRTDK